MKIAKIIGLVLSFFSVAFFFVVFAIARVLTSRSSFASSRSASSVDEAKVKGRGVSSFASAFYSLAFVASALATRTPEPPNAAFAQPSTFASNANGGSSVSNGSVSGGSSVSNGSVSGGSSVANGGGNGDGRGAPRRFDPLRRDALGVQTRYPAVAKIVGRDAPQTREDGSQTIPLYYGTGTFVAEAGEWGLVVSCWHVVNEARDSIVVKFPTFSSPARVILRDETWDLAALVVRKPPRVAPIPISQEVPGVGDALWVAGYGESAGLTEFQIQGGRVQNYALLVDDADASQDGANGANGAPSGLGANAQGVGATISTTPRPSTPTPEGALLYETLAVDKGVRQGDSGGPIFNRYGELAGVLWGSNGESTMGTYCIRAQYFLTQAIERLAALEAERRLDASSNDDLLTWLSENGVADAEGTKLWARTALEASGVHPIARGPAYVAADGRETPENLRRVGVEAALKRVRTALTVAENATATALPPSPPVFSPTFVSQQGLQRRDRPEVADPDFWTKLVDSEYGELVARRTSEAARVRETSVVDAEPDATANVASAFAAKNETNADFADERPALPWRGKPERLAAPTQGNDAALKSKRPLISAAKNDGAASGELAVALWKPVGLEGDGEREKTSEGGAAREESADWERDEKTNDVEKTTNREDEESAVESAEKDVEGETDGSRTDAKSGESATSINGAEEKERGKRVNFNGFYLNDLQVYLIICAIFCLFYNAARLMTDADLKKEQKRRRFEGRARSFEGRDD